MSWISGGFFAAALALAVSLGGQTLDYSWGPALIALAVALLTACTGASGSRDRGKGTWIALVFLALAWGWILWRAWSSPVREFARSDSLLAGGMMAGCFWALLVAPGGAAVRIAMAALALLGLADLGIGLYQMKDPHFAWPFASRPADFPSGLFGHYNHLADFSVVSAALLAARLFLAGDRAWERWLQVLGTLAAIGCIFISGSRGGIVSLCAAAVVLVATFAMRAWRDKSRHRSQLAIVAVATPLLLGAIAVPVLGHFQQRRGIENGGSLNRFADNRSRLHAFGMAVDLAAKHPLTGGGSRSYGWQKYAAWNPAESGLEPPNDDFVHNELLQTAVDYGWVGALLVGTAVLATALCSVAGLLSADPSRGPRPPVDALMCGGLAAMAGTLTHSNFSFVSHTIPGAIYLGLAVGFALPRRAGEPAPYFSPAPALVAALLVLPLVLWSGYSGYRATVTYRSLWPVLFGKERMRRTDPGLAVDRLRMAIDVWPGSELAGIAAYTARNASSRKGLTAGESRDWLSQAVDLFATASTCNPYDPEWVVNRAKALSDLGRAAEANREYERAILVEGGMEATFRARYYYAMHLYQYWYREWTQGGVEGREGRAGKVLAGFIQARELAKEAATLTEAWIRGKEEAEFLQGLEKSISFLEGAGVVPTPAKP